MNILPILSIVLLLVLTPTQLTAQPTVLKRCGPAFPACKLPSTCAGDNICRDRCVPCSNDTPCDKGFKCDLGMRRCLMPRAAGGVCNDRKGCCTRGSGGTSGMMSLDVMASPEESPAPSEEVQVEESPMPTALSNDAREGCRRCKSSKDCKSGYVCDGKMSKCVRRLSLRDSCGSADTCSQCGSGLRCKKTGYCLTFGNGVFVICTLSRRPSCRLAKRCEGTMQCVRRK